MKSMEAGVGIEPAYTDLQCDRIKKCPDFSGHKRFGNCFVAQATAQFWHKDQRATPLAFS